MLIPELVKLIDRLVQTLAQSDRSLSSEQKISHERT